MALLAEVCLSLASRGISIFRKPVAEASAWANPFERQALRHRLLVLSVRKDCHSHQSLRTVAATQAAALLHTEHSSVVDFQVCGVEDTPSCARGVGQGIPTVGHRCFPAPWCDKDCL